MSLEVEYKSLLRKKVKLEKEIKELKFFIKINKREFDNIKYIELDLERGIKCRKELIYGSL